MKPKIYHFDLWEQELAEELQFLVGCTYSDAQGILEANDFEVTQYWGLGLSPLDASKKLYIKTKQSQP